MVPLARTVTVGRETTRSELLAISERTGFARFPVRDGNAIVVANYGVCEGNPAAIRPRMPCVAAVVLSTELINRAPCGCGGVSISVVVNRKANTWAL
jgi:hypothetical protein